MRILYLIDLWDPRIGSSVRQMYQLAGRLRELGHETSVVSTTPDRSRTGWTQAEGTDVYRIHSDYPPRFRAWVALRHRSVLAQLRPVLEELSPDVVHSYLHFTIPPPPSGRTLSSAQMSVHTTRGYDSDGTSPGQLSVVEPFDEVSLDRPGAANTPAVIATAAAPPAESIDQFEPKLLDLLGDVASPGELFLELAPTGTNAVWLYSHEPPRAELSRRPHLILNYE